jgi:hypothetical protein
MVMGRSSGTSILKRQREIKKAERAAEKRARRHGKPIERSIEPRPTVTTTSAPPSGEKPASGDRDESA